MKDTFCASASILLLFPPPTNTEVPIYYLQYQFKFVSVFCFHSFLLSPVMLTLESLTSIQVFPAFSALSGSKCGDPGVCRLCLGCREQASCETFPEEPSFTLSDFHLGLQLLYAFFHRRSSRLSFWHLLPHFKLVPALLFAAM